MKKTSILTPSRAFTFIELLMVIAIIGILAAVLWPALVNKRDLRLDELAIGNIDVLSESLERFSIDSEESYLTAQQRDSISNLILEFERAQEDSKSNKSRRIVNIEELFALLDDTRDLTDDLSRQVQDFSNDLSEERERTMQSLDVLVHAIDDAYENVVILRAVASSRSGEIRSNFIALCALITAAIIGWKGWSMAKDSKEIASIKEDLSRYEKRLKRFEGQNTDAQPNTSSETDRKSETTLSATPASPSIKRTESTHSAEESADPIDNS